jgi:GxxExxY protein
MIHDTIIELKAVSKLTKDSVIQIRNYMKHHQMNNGIIINFGQPTKNCTGQLEMKWIQQNQIVDCITNETEIL